MPTGELTDVEHRIIDALDEVSARLGEISVSLAEQSASLKDYLRRTETLERQMNEVWAHVVFVKGLHKMLAMLASVSSIIGGVWVILRGKH